MSSRCPTRDELERLHAGELPAERAAAVEGHLRDCATCGRLDAELREEHEAMLAELGGLPPTAPHARHHDQETATAASSASGATSLIGQRIGSYTIQGMIGEGGMGAVYRAQQDKPRQMVALKVIRGGLPSPREMRRFEFESEVLGHLQHIGIARIYQAGLFETPFGQQPYFAMELIDGQALNAFADQARLGTRQRLELIARVADAVQHAHSNGIMHLDLKPGNVLVTADRQPKVVDFGLARLAPGPQPPALAGVRLTTILGGTPAYMSPEQVSGDPRDVDARSDVYSLGVVAYELLTGRLPYSSLNSSDRRIGPNDVFRIVREEEPTRLTRATRWDGSSARAFAGDVEAIVHKALEKDKERRYQTAAALAADIRRYLTDQPIAARPASALYQLKKFATRNRALVGGVLASLSLLAASSVVLAALWRWAAIAERAAVDRAAEASAAAQSEYSERIRADKQEAAAQREAQNATFQAAIARTANDFLNRDLLGSLRLDAPGSRMDITVREILDRASSKLGDPNAVQVPGQMSAAARQLVEASVRTTLGTAFVHLGLPAEAEQHLVIAIETRQRLLGTDNLDLADSLYALGEVRGFQKRQDDARRLLDQALAIRRKQLGRDHPLTLLAQAALVQVTAYAVAPGAAEQFIFEMYLSFVLDMLDPGDFPSYLAQAMIEVRRINDQAGHDSALSYLRDVLNEQLRQVRMSEAAGRPNDAVARVLAQFRPLLKYPQLRNMVPAMLLEHARQLRAKNDLLAADAFARAAYTMTREVLGDATGYLAQVQHVSAWIQLDLGRPVEAEQLLRFALGVATHDEDGQWCLVITADLGAVLLNLGRYAEAESLLRAAYDETLRREGAAGKNTVIVREDLSNVLDQRGRAADAERLHREAVQAQVAAYGPAHPAVAPLLRRLSRFLLQHGTPDEAELTMREALEIHLVTAPLDDPCQLHVELALCLAANRKYFEAERLLREAVMVRQAVLLEQDPSTASARGMLGDVLVASAERSPVLEGRQIQRIREAEQLLLDAHGDLVRRSASSPGTVPVAKQSEALQRIVRLYSVWHAVEPNNGYDVKAAEWRARLAEWQASTQPSNSEERRASNEFRGVSLEYRVKTPRGSPRSRRSGRKRRCGFQVCLHDIASASDAASAEP